MGKFFTDDQIQEAIGALESYSPGIFKRMTKMASITAPLNEEQEREMTAITRVLGVVLPEVSFVVKAEDKGGALTRLTIDLGNAVQAAAEFVKGSPDRASISKND
ncbi:MULTISPECIES: hypothetical protein [unclassified Bradyrhizobium]|uniref:hypothetical protein n=1 Tax=unclassified Bradyrhizobium TaxID=2631580 RepID=UPI002915D3BA|nr:MULTISPECIES: hypothetical protein [unclassified Bradyrhizobium]